MADEQSGGSGVRCGNAWSWSGASRTPAGRKTSVRQGNESSAREGEAKRAIKIRALRCCTEMVCWIGSERLEALPARHQRLGSS